MRIRFHHEASAAARCSKQPDTSLLIIIKESDNIGYVLKRVSIKPIGSYTVVDTIAGLIHDGRLPYKGLAIVDGDKIDECKNDCIGLQGTIAPEKQVFTDLKAIIWENLGNRFGIGAGTLFQILQDSMLNPDHHEWTTYVGDRVKQSKSYVWNVMVEE